MSALRWGQNNNEMLCRVMLCARKPKKMPFRVRQKRKGEMPSRIMFYYREDEKVSSRVTFYNRKHAL